MDRAQWATVKIFTQNLRGTLTNSAKLPSDGLRRPSAVGEDPWVGRLRKPAPLQGELFGAGSKEWRCSPAPGDASQLKK